MRSIFGLDRAALVLLLVFKVGSSCCDDAKWPPATQQRESVHAGQTQVDDGQVEGILTPQKQAVFAILGRIRQQLCVPVLTDGQEDGFTPLVPEWALSREGVHRITRRFEFTDFVEAMAFVNKVADVAEEEATCRISR